MRIFIMHVRRWVCALIGVALVGCELESPYARVNPFDPGGVVRLSMSGPDSAVFAGQRVRYTVDASHPLPSGSAMIAWRSSDPLRLIAGTAGEYIVTNATARFVPVEVSVLFDSVRVSRTVLVGQTVARLALWCGPVGGPMIACEAGAGTTLLVRATMADSSTTPVRQPLYAVQRAVVSSSDSSVVRPAVDAAGDGTLAVTARAAGQAWMRVQVDGARDSVLVVVRP
ncbi:MAG: hypothetical protein RI891_1051 [Gemmatimonadota bacterium]|jgi:hypothetical protein